MDGYNLKTDIYIQTDRQIRANGGVKGRREQMGKDAKLSGFHLHVIRERG